MEIYISLFGKKKNVLDWLKLLEQEKVPFEYKGERLENFSSVNILVGFPKEKIKKFQKKEKDRVFLLESAFTLPSRGKLIKAYKLLNIPYIHFWYYPTTYPSVFLFRVDIDYVDFEGVKNILEITKRYRIRGTYFVNISGDEEFDEEIDFSPLKVPTTPQRREILQKLLNENNELANHGYRHKVYDDFESNYKNIKKCGYYLKKLFNIKDRGFSSPGGEWNKELLKAISKNKLSYCSHTTSEESKLPFYEYYNGEKMKVLEIPFYEVSDGKFEPFLKNSQNLKHIQKVSEKLKKNYLKYIERQLKNNEPIAIMAHPHLLGKIAKNVLLPVLRKISQLKIPNYTLKEFAEWWKERENFELKYYKRNNKIEIHSNNPALVEIVFRKNRKILKVNKTTIIKC